MDWTQQQSVVSLLESRWPASGEWIWIWDGKSLGCREHHSLTNQYRAHTLSRARSCLLARRKQDCDYWKRKADQNLAFQNIQNSHNSQRAHTRWCLAWTVVGSGSNDGSIRKWDTTTWKQFAVLKGLFLQLQYLTIAVFL